MISFYAVLGTLILFLWPNKWSLVHLKNKRGCSDLWYVFFLKDSMTVFHCYCTENNFLAEPLWKQNWIFPIFQCKIADSLMRSPTSGLLRVVDFVRERPLGVCELAEILNGTLYVRKNSNITSLTVNETQSFFNLALISEKDFETG